MTEWFEVCRVWHPVSHCTPFSPPFCCILNQETILTELMLSQLFLRCDASIWKGTRYKRHQEICFWLQTLGGTDLLSLGFIVGERRVLEDCSVLARVWKDRVTHGYSSCWELLQQTSTALPQGVSQELAELGPWVRAGKAIHLTPATQAQHCRLVWFSRSK